MLRSSGETLEWSPVWSKSLTLYFIPLPSVSFCWIYYQNLERTSLSIHRDTLPHPVLNWVLPAQSSPRFPTGHLSPTAGKLGSCDSCSQGAHSGVRRQGDTEHQRSGRQDLKYQMPHCHGDHQHFFLRQPGPEGPSWRVPSREVLFIFEKTT